MRTPLFKCGLQWGVAVGSLALAGALAFAATKDLGELERAAKVPPMPPIKEFAPIWTEGTFRPPDPTVAVSVASSAGSVDGWSLLALIKIREETFAILQKEKTGLRMYVGPKPNPDEYSVESAHFDEDPEKEFVTVRHKQKTVELHYLPPILEELKKRYQVLEESGTVPGPSHP